MPIKEAIEKGNKCLEDRENIPSAPLWHMGKVAILESKESFDLLQNTIDYLTCKGKLNISFTDNEKEFMKEIFEALWWGGQYHGFKEAATLADHYVNGKGRNFSINSRIYTDSIIVKDTISALKLYIKELSSNKKSISAIKTSDRGFLDSRHSSHLKKGRRNENSQGCILHNGALQVEQLNQPLKNTDHRFYLFVNTTNNGNVFLSYWKVESIYDFEPFDKEYITNIPLTKDFILKLPDGLSHHLTKIGVAGNFNYISTWQELWK
ncbi:MAG: hypothetical protein L3J98_11845 [Gammaproteobacteria bacterium]|nr:hypothetical protein [Gammaproteobacteria bacterium]MCF6260831.1 hypothetical protein [Gammaproteobacteria bacterium]